MQGKEDKHCMIVCANFSVAVSEFYELYARYPPYKSVKKTQLRIRIQEMMQNITSFISKASPIFKELEEKISSFRQAISTHNAVQSFTCSAGILEMKPAIMGFVGTMANITSILTKTRDGLLIDMRRANALSDRNEFSKIESCTSTVVCFYNANLSISDCQKLLCTNPPTLQCTTIKHGDTVYHTLTRSEKRRRRV